MLFDHQAGRWESEKERNLYSKFFAGYFFNELVPGWEERLAAFCALLETKAQEVLFPRPRPIALIPSHTHVSFDNHIWRLSQYDRGEFADILIYDNALWIPLRPVLIEFSCDKDIICNLNRIASIPAARLNGGPSSVPNIDEFLKREPLTSI